MGYLAYATNTIAAKWWELWAAGHPYARISAEFGVSSKTISDAVTGKTWRRVK